MDAIPGWEDGTEKENLDVEWEALERTLSSCGVVLDEKSKVLEVGSGKGVFLEFLKKRRINVVGVDIRPRDNKAGVQVQARVEGLPFADGEFDLVYSSQAFDVVQYFQDQVAMLNEISRVLKQGGIYIGSAESISAQSPTSLKKMDAKLMFKDVYKKA